MRKTCITGKHPPPVGTSGWEMFSQKCICFDKTRMIKELVDRVTTVAIFTRPGRFGKTTAMKMIRAFFEKRVDGKDRKVGASYLFKGHRTASWEDAFEFMMRDVGPEIYNPWSVLYCFSNNCRPGPYWLDTSSNDLITEIVSLALAFRGKKAVLRKG